MRAGALVLTLGLLAPMWHGPPARALDPMDTARIGSCLAHAGELLARHQTTLGALEQGRSVRSVAPHPVFAPFEGAWQGHWGDLPVAHRWKSVAPGVQLVVALDGATWRQGINLVDAHGTICGLMREGPGDYRVHEGRPVNGALVWRTPERAYIEWVEHDLYTIEEWLVHRGHARAGRVATYHRPVATR